MEKVDLNEFAKEITLLEGKKESVNMGQVKEILSITLKKLAALEPPQVDELLSRYR
jgi:hypothetical protein